MGTLAREAAPERMRASRALRWASACAIGAAVAARGGPERGDDLIEMGASDARRALEQLEAVGHEDAEQRAVLDVEQSLDRRAVGAQALGWPGWKPTLSSCGRPSSSSSTRHAGGVGVEAHELALVARPRRASGAAEVDRLEQVRLAGAVGAVDDGQTLTEGDLGARVGAEVAQLDAEHAHRIELTR